MCLFPGEFHCKQILKSVVWSDCNRLMIKFITIIIVIMLKFRSKDAKLVTRTNGPIPETLPYIEEHYVHMVKRKETKHLDYGDIKVCYSF